jgi:hypothetical protein
MGESDFFACGKPVEAVARSGGRSLVKWPRVDQSEEEKEGERNLEGAGATLAFKQ